MRSAATLTDVSQTLKSTANWSTRESTSSTSHLYRIAVTFLTLGLRHPGRGMPKDVLDKQNQGICRQFVQNVDRVEADDLVPRSCAGPGERGTNWERLQQIIKAALSQKATKDQEIR